MKWVLCVQWLRLAVTGLGLGLQSLHSLCQLHTNGLLTLIEGPFGLHSLHSYTIGLSQHHRWGLGFKNQNDNMIPSVLNKAKELAPCLYNIDEMRKDELSDHKIISEEKLKCEAEKRLKVKQIKSPLSYHGFLYVETQFEEPPKFPLKRRNVNLNKHLKQFEQAEVLKKHLEQAQLRDHDPKLWNSLPMKYFCYVKQAMIKFEKQTFSKLHLSQDNKLNFEQSYEHNINTRVRNRLIDEFEPLVKNVNLQLNCIEKSLVKEMKDDLKDETNQCDDVKLKFDFDEIETQNIELKHKVASLIKENEHLKLVYKNLFDSIKKSRVLTQSSNVSQNEAENLKSQLSEFADKKFNNVFQKIESMKKKKFESRNSNDLLQKSLYDSDPSNVESESGEKKILFGNDTSSFETKIKELEMTLAQQTKDFEDAKVDFSKKTDKFETYFEKLEKTKVVLERQLDRKIQDSNAEKDQFLKQIASLESKLASQDLISNQKEYNNLRTSYNALKAKFDSLNWDKGKSPISKFSTPKVSVSKKIYMGESSNSFQKKVSQFTTYSLKKDRKFSKKPQVFETPTSQKAFKSVD
ncbi:hypothetical protein Tco_0828108 [Tanacetum coccineum]